MEQRGKGTEASYGGFKRGYKSKKSLIFAFGFELLDEALKLGGEGRSEVDGFACARVGEVELGGVEEVAVEGEDVGAFWRVGGGLKLGYAACGAVEGVADDRVVDGGHVDADLMGAAGFDADLDEGEFAEAGLYAFED